ncbi:protein-L-isoaspartate O-methyltransferase [Burkholderia sp. WAC0059]|uniref:protein-L-isoaspartate(D-aspartate) O-methyltransferase n=1 Tax=Burkholderia sp. WAC0059 TaxID=2066022 RepID=UPI000C7F6AA5|nr:protein-L-isoaspartate(D-aspartate) O-methyltransferase [Burkholderia sp. WAC0059]PLZ03655.1 protein-L-isoaspartate O-methyltransferase [Burkholderia sp. WAC0059]
MGACRRRRFMTSGARPKRFPLGLADLEREPRRRDERPGEARVSQPGTGKGAVGAARHKSATAAGGTATAAVPARASSAAPAGITKVAGGPKAVAATGPARHAAGPAGKPPARRPDFPLAAALPRASLPSVGGAPAVALNGALALTSERVRERMVERLRANGVTDPRVLQALAGVPRHMFVDPGLAAQAYEDAALPIGHHQTISKPSVVARMLELAGAGRDLDRVLEIGTGCGYQAAVLSRIARDVYSIERIKPLYERAKTNLRPLRIPNIRLHYGDGRLGLPPAAPFDAIVIAAAGLDVPQALLEQLAIGGRLVAPVAEQGTPGEASQVLTLVERTGPAQWRESRLDRVFFVPLKSGVI